MLDRKGQGLSLTVIIVAAIALVVLVVLILVFTGRIGIFEKTLGGEADAELTSMKTFYGTCHPSITAELGFKSDYNQAADFDSETEKAQAKAEAKASFNDEISRCKTVGDSRDNCDNTGCRWSG